MEQVVAEMGGLARTLYHLSPYVYFGAHFECLPCVTRVRLVNLQNMLFLVALVQIEGYKSQIRGLCVGIGIDRG